MSLGSLIDLGLKDTLGIDKKAFIVDDFLSQIECESFIDLASELGFSSIQTSKYGEEWADTHLRTNECAYAESPELARILFNCVKPFLPDANSLNTNLRFNKFKEDTWVQPHVDGYIRLNDQRNLYTLVVYLSTPESGGETRFINFQTLQSVDVEPKRGRVLLFDPSLCHCALPVKGQTSKYTLRTDVMVDIPREEVSANIYNIANIENLKNKDTNDLDM